VQAGLLSHEIVSSGVPTLLVVRKATSLVAYREPPADPARSENLCMCGIFMRDNREIPWSLVGLIASRAAQARPRP